MKTINLKIKPFSLWVSYNLLNPNPIQDMLPKNMELANIKILEDDVISSPRLLFNCYNIDSFLMKGSRLEIMTIAKKNKDFHFVVLDCISNTIQWDPINNIRGPNGNIKFSYLQENLNCKVIKFNNKFNFRGTPLDLINMTNDFAVKSNYECFFRNSEESVKLSFNEEEIMRPVRKLKIINLENNFWKKYRSDFPDHIFMHEKSMSFKTKMPKISIF